MSVYFAPSLGFEWPEEDIAVASGRCFFCGQEIQGFLVHWAGVTEHPHIALHPACALKLGQHLIKDGFAADYLERGKSPTLGIHYPKSGA